MASKKPWRTVIISEETGRLTHEQIHAAIQAVKEESERKAAARAAARKKLGTSKPVRVPAQEKARTAPKAA